MPLMNPSSFTLDGRFNQIIKLYDMLEKRVSDLEDELKKMKKENFELLDIVLTDDAAKRNNEANPATSSPNPPEGSNES